MMRLEVNLDVSPEIAKNVVPTLIKAILNEYFDKMPGKELKVQSVLVVK